MRFTTSLTLIATAVGLASAVPLEPREAGLDRVKLEQCGKPDDPLHFDDISLKLNPPVVGKPLTIKMKGELKREIEEGAWVEYRSRASILTFTGDFPLCKAIKNRHNVTCPIKPGKFDTEFTFVADFLEISPPLVEADMTLITKNKDGSQINCIKSHLKLR